MTQVWQLLRRWADERPGGMHDSQIARALDVKPQLVAKWKQGSIPNPDHLRRIAEVIGADYDVLFTAAMRDRGYTPPPIEDSLGDIRDSLRSSSVEKKTGTD